MKIMKTWNKNKYNEYIKYLNKIGDEKTEDFSKRITMTNYEVIGIKIPMLRSIAKDISKTDIKSFLELCENNYYEEILIEGFVIGSIKDYDLFLKYFNKFIYKIDCWAICDSCISSFKIMKKYDFSSLAYSLILDSREFIIRVGYIMLMDFYIDDNHIKDILEISKKESSYYYVNMAIAWLLSVCFIKYRTNTLELLKEKKLTPFVQNKTISKIRESYRVSEKDKEIVNKLKIIQ